MAIVSILDARKTALPTGLDEELWSTSTSACVAGHEEHVAEMLSRAVSMTQPWWYASGVRVDLQPGLTKPILSPNRRLVWCMVNLLIAYAKGLRSGQVLRITTWQEDDYVRLHFACEADAKDGPNHLRQGERLGSFWDRARAFARSASAELQLTASGLSADLRVPLCAEART